MPAAAPLTASTSSQNVTLSVSPSVTSVSPTVSGGSSAGTGAAGPDKVLVVVEENHSAAAALNDMPFLAGLADRYGQTTDFQAVAHPSLPNYLAIAGGSTFDVTDDDPPAKHPIDQTSVMDEAIAAGVTARTYAEAMPRPCTVGDVGRYAVKHNPWTYFSAPASQANCQQFDVPAGSPDQGALRDDVLAGAMPTIGLLIPDLCNDAHDCSLQVADSWLGRWIPFIMAGPDYRGGRLAIVVTFDEDDRTAGNTVLTTVIAPTVSSERATTPLNHYSISRYLAEVAGVQPLGAAVESPSLAAAFTI